MNVIADEELCPCGSMKSWGGCCKGSVEPEFFERVEVPSGGGPGHLERLMKEGYDAFKDRNHAGAVEPWLTL